MKIAIIDNYDSFTYNLVHYTEAILDQKIDVYRNDLQDIEVLSSYSHLLLSPGPGLPQEAGKLMDIIARYAESKKILGICLGLQALGVYFGAELVNLNVIKHGLQEEIIHYENGKIFNELPTTLKVGRYHSWSIQLPENHKELEVTARDKEKCIMGIKHRLLPIEAVQFHPESIMTPDGRKMVENWLRLI